MAKKSVDKDLKKQMAMNSFLQFVDVFGLDVPMHIPIFCLDVSSKHTGFMMMDADIHNEENELADLVPLDNDESTWDKTQTINTKEKVAFALYPQAMNKVNDFKIALIEALDESEAKFLSKNNISVGEFYSKDTPYPKFLSVESVFLFQKSAIVPLTRFQNIAINILMERGYIPFEYENTEAKGLLGVKGKKEYVVPMINDMYCIDIPLPLNEKDDRYTHVGDAIALGYYHNYIMRKAIRER